MKPKTDNGFIQIACGKPDNDILTALAGAGLYSTEFEVVLVVIRKTWGWKKNWDWISLSTFQKLTRKSRPMIVQALSDLVVKQILLVDKKDKNKPLYAFNERFLEWTSKPQLTSKVELTSKPQLTTLVKQSLPILVKQSLPTKEKKETIQKKEKKIMSADSFFNSLKEETNEQVISRAKEFDVRPKDIIYSAKMANLWANGKELAEDTEYGWSIFFSKWVLNSIRYHKLKTLSDKSEEVKKPFVSTEDKWILENVKII